MEKRRLVWAVLILVVLILIVWAIIALVNKPQEPENPGLVVTPDGDTLPDGSGDAASDIDSAIDSSVVPEEDDLDLGSVI